jgi:parvulin-like peptidyl-prolyl isomerase
MRQGAPDKGIDLSEEAIDVAIGRQEGVPAGTDRNTFAASYRKAVRESGLSTEGYRDIVAAELAEEALRSMFNEQAPKTAEQVRFRTFLVATEDDAETALERLRNGEDFAVVAQELSEDAASGGQGVEQDWTPRGILEPTLDEALFSLKIGEISDVIVDLRGIFIVEVLEREAARQTTPDQQSLLASQAMDDWLDELRERLGVTVTLDEDQRGSLQGVLLDEINRGQ